MAHVKSNLWEIDMTKKTVGIAAVLVVLAMPVFGAEDEATEMVVHKDPYCGCCTAWADLAEEAGYAVETVVENDMVSIKDGLDVPEEFWSCHTVEIDGYVIEGHVPFDAVARLLEERPEITGIAVPGMPAGSPGMGDDPAARYDVVAFGGDAGRGALYQRVGK